MLTTRRPKNKAEGGAFDALEALGFYVTKRGWPDFFAWRKDGEFVVCEAKPAPGRRLRLHQRIVLKALRSKGIRTLWFDPVTGLSELPRSARTIGGK